MTDATLQSEPAAMPVRSLGKRVRSTAGYVILAALMLVTPLLVFLPAALLHCGIRNGRRASWIVLGPAAVLALLLLLPGAQGPQSAPGGANGVYAFVLGALLVVGVPSLLIHPLVERGERFGRVLAFALLAAVLGMLATEVIMRAAAAYSPFAAHVAAAQEITVQVTAAYTAAGVPAEFIRGVRKSMNIGIFVLPGAMLVESAMVFVLSLVMLGRLPAWRQFAARRGLASPMPYLFRNLALPEWLLFAFVIGGISPLLSGVPQRITANLLTIVVFLYLLQGLSLVRAFLAAAGAGCGATLFAYGLLGVLMITGIALLPLGIAGLFDSFFDFRHFNRKDHSDESHSH